MSANPATRMIALTKVRQLDLSATTPGRPLHLSAASGLACVNSFIYVVADDELHLGVFRANSGEPGHLIRLFEGELPTCKVDRKKQKADFEALTLLPSYKDYPCGALLAFGSGSRPNRRLGALLRLDPQGAVRGSPQVVNCSHILASLDGEFPALEGAVVSGAELRLFQRGNQRHSKNAIIRFQLSTFLDALSSDQTAITPLAINTFDLEQIEGIPLCFTDAAALPDGTMVFTAVAEDTDDNYKDGACTGAAVGIVDKELQLQCLYRLERPYKVEGVNARVEGDVIRLLMVTDADDFEIPAALFSTTIIK